MKRNALLVILLLTLPGLGMAQSQTRDRRSTDQASPETSTIRNRTVGPRAANHAESQKSSDGAVSNSVTPIWGTPRSSDQERPRWGNATVPARSVGKEPIPSTTVSSDIKASNSSLSSASPKSPSQENRSGDLVVALASGNVDARRSALSIPSAPTTTYRVGAGDVLDIRLSNLPTRESTLFTVQKDGSLEYPLLGKSLTVAGLTSEEISAQLSNQIQVIQNARVSVSVRDYVSHAVQIAGLVDNPGKKILRREAMPLYAVLAEALARPEAANISILRAGKQQSVSLKSDDAMTTLVLPDDVIRVSGVEAIQRRFIYVGGEVAAPGEREFHDGMTLIQALMSAGGARSGKNGVKVSRRNANGFLTANEYNLQAIEGGKSPDPVVAAGDRIEVTRNSQ